MLTDRQLGQAVPIEGTTALGREADLAGWGLLTLDAHHDVRPYRPGPPGNGSPVRALIDAGLQGANVVQVGIHGFSNSPLHRAWCEEHPGGVGEGYLLSKQAIIVWTLHAALDLAPKGIRVNCTSPGPTQTPMMPSFEQYMGKDFMDRFPKPLGGRNSTPEEQGPLVVFLNSDAASYITGTNVYADGGFSAGMLTSRLDFSVLSGETPAS